MDPTFTITLATVDRQPTVIGLIEEASEWLRGKDTDQWSRPWPDRRGRDDRIRQGLERGETWLVRDGATPVATMTICRTANPAVWPYPDGESAVYVHRVVVSRAYAGLGLGGLMFDWAVQRESRTRDVKWLRVDVWSTNAGLHAYYERQGFQRCGTCDDPAYPSGALFQKAAQDCFGSDMSLLVDDTAG
jgi:GNAT superfamily N-acetyltransferase